MNRASQADRESRLYVGGEDGNVLIGPGDPAGAADESMAAHLAAADPHPQYQKESELGTAAFEDVEAFDPAGAADDAVADHEAAANPHPQYLLPSALSDVEAYLTPATNSMTGGTWNLLASTTEVRDTLSEFDPTNASFTPGTTGLYLVTWVSSLTANPTTKHALAIYQGSSTPIAYLNSTSTNICGCSAIVPLTSGVAYRFAAFVDGTVSWEGGDASLTRVAIRRLK